MKIYAIFAEANPNLTQNAKLKIINNDFMHAMAATVCIKFPIAIGDFLSPPNDFSVRNICI